MSKIRLIKFALAGLFAGAANGLFGSGGGLLLVPVLSGELSEKEAFATSVFCMCIMSIISVIVYSGSTMPNVYSALPYVLGGIIGGVVGGRVFKRVPPDMLRRIFALFMIWAGIRAVIK